MRGSWRIIQAWRQWRELKRAARLIRRSSAAFERGQHHRARALLDEAGVILEANRPAIG